jgi:hypothetical protein
MQDALTVGVDFVEKVNGIIMVVTDACVAWTEYDWFYNCLILN